MVEAISNLKFGLYTFHHEDLLYGEVCLYIIFTKN